MKRNAVVSGLAAIVFVQWFPAVGCGGRAEGEDGGTTPGAIPQPGAPDGAVIFLDGGQICAKTVCNGACIDTQSDGFNCGSCGNVCNGNLVCSLGVCSATCAMGLTLCGNSCVDPQSNAAHCGSCNAACLNGQQCIAGQCRVGGGCPQGLTFCQGGMMGGMMGTSGCVDLQSEGFNCGSCGTVCWNGTVCSMGQCAQSCSQGLVACGNSCVNLQSSKDHCGFCQQICAGNLACTNGQCSCPNGTMNCNGICKNKC